MNPASLSHPEMDVRLLPIASLRPAPYNPRERLRPGDPAYEKLAASLREFGLVEPLVWNEATGHVVGGHARLGILRTLGVTEVPVSVVRLTPAREKALNVVLNNREAQARFDTELLAELLAELQDAPELLLTGFDAGDLAAFRMEPVQDLLPPPPEPAHVEITLVTDPDTYTLLAPRLNDLVGEFDLTATVRRTE